MYPSGPTVLKAFFAAVADVHNVRKSKQVDTGKYTYWHATLDDVLEEVKRVCTANGLVMIQIPAAGDAQHWTLTTHFYHVETGETLMLDPYTRPEVRDEQGFGSALSYGRRYALTTIFNMVAEDDDGKEATEAQRAPNKFDGNRSAEELTIRTIMKGQSPEVVTAFGEQFKTSMGQPLSALPVNKHADALTFVLQFLSSRDEEAAQLPADPPAGTGDAALPLGGMPSPGIPPPDEGVTGEQKRLKRH